jgi:hypothetical protein
MPPSARFSPDDPNLPAAWQQWATQALGRLDQLPKLTQSQLSAIAGAAAGVGEGAFLNSAAAGLGLGVGVGAAGPGTGTGTGTGAAGAGAGAGGVAGVGANNLGIDLPASLAALFEAKLTLDREKAKLMRMQKELKGYREGVAAVNGNGNGNGNGSASAGKQPSNGKGKEVVVDDDLEECLCGRHG